MKNNSTRLKLRKIAFLAGSRGPLSPEFVRRRQILQAASTQETVIDKEKDLWKQEKVSINQTTNPGVLLNQYMTKC